MHTASRYSSELCGPAPQVSKDLGKVGCDPKAQLRRRPGTRSGAYIGVLNGRHGFRDRDRTPGRAHAPDRLTISGVRAGILLFTPRGHDDRLSTFFTGSFGCEDVQYEYERLSAGGAKLLGPRQSKPFLHLCYNDLNGNTFFLSIR